MKKLILAVAAVMVSVAAFGQGEVQFNNRITGVVDARVTFADGSGAVGAGYTATLWGGPENGALSALTPTTTFRTSSAAALGYLTAVTVAVPGVAAGQKASLQVRITGPNVDEAKSVSNTISVALGGGTLPPAALEGLQAFTVTIPEPSTIALGVIGAAALFLRRRK